MRTICFFSSYYLEDAIPVYVKYYLKELSNYFTEVVLITNEKILPDKDKIFLQEHNCKSFLVQNEGYDFGMWYKAFLNYDATKYDRVGLVNDSCILFGKLEKYFQWMEAEKPDFSGFTDSYLHGYHIQSYFLVVNKSALLLVSDYFKRNGIQKDINDVIKIYEIGLSKYLSDNGMKCRAMYNVPEKGKYNYALLQAKNLIKQGFPLIKKKIITRQYVSERWRSMVVIGFDPFPAHYIKLIKSTSNCPYDMFEGLTNRKGLIDGLKFNLISLLAIIKGRITNKRKLK